MKLFLSIIFGFGFLFIVAFLFMSVGLEISVDVFNPDPSIYDDEDASSGIFIVSNILAIIFGRYSYLAMEHRKLRVIYTPKEKDLTIIWIKCSITFAILTTVFDLYIGYYIGSATIDNLSYLWYFISAFIAWYLFGQKYFNPLKSIKFFK
jgi:hypothetical protein